MILLVLALLLLTFSVGIILYGRRNYGALVNSGFPVIPPTLFLGSDPHFYREVQHLKDLERYKTYGPIWGLYMGATPQVMICDPDLIRDILVKDSDYFNGRRERDVGSPVLNEILDFLPAEKWHRIRTKLSPLFTTAKLKSMTSMITANAQEFVQDLKDECGSSGRIKFDCKIRLTTWLIDMFAQSTLGIQLANRKEPNNQFATALRKMLGEDTVYGILYSLSLTFPWLRGFAPAFDPVPAKLVESTLRHILDARPAPTGDNCEFFYVLNDLRSKVGSAEFRQLGITEMTVISQAVSFFIGSETLSATLSHFLYFMATHPKIQDRLHSELDSKFGSAEAITTDHESLQRENVPFLTACLNETLRLAPSVRPERICTKNWTSAQGFRIRKGTEVHIPMFPASRIPTVYQDPDEFKPQRFLGTPGSLNPYTFSAFGHGTRNCIGMRFAYSSIKIFLIHFFINFKLEVRSDTVLKYRKGMTAFLLFDPLYLDVVRRVK